MWRTHVRTYGRNITPYAPLLPLAGGDIKIGLFRRNI